MNNLSKLIPYRSVPILAYHQIAKTSPEEDRLRLAVPPETFESQMKYLHDHGYTTVALDELAEAENNKKRDPRKLIAITFDDGYLDNYTNAFPILQKYGFSATIFAVTDFIGKSHAWISCAPMRYMDWSHAREMERYEISFQSHTCTHPDLTKLSVAEGIQELTNSRKKIEDCLGNPVRHFAYPYGKYNNEVIEMVKETGYLSSYAAGMSERGGFARERFSVELKNSPFLFYFKASHLGSWVRTIRNSLFPSESEGKK